MPIYLHVTTGEFKRYAPNLEEDALSPLPERRGIQRETFDEKSYFPLPFCQKPRVSSSMPIANITTIKLGIVFRLGWQD